MKIKKLLALLFVLSILACCNKHDKKKDTKTNIEAQLECKNCNQWKQKYKKLRKKVKRLDELKLDESNQAVIIETSEFYTESHKAVLQLKVLKGTKKNMIKKDSIRNNTIYLSINSNEIPCDSKTKILEYTIKSDSLRGDFIKVETDIYCDDTQLAPPKKHKTSIVAGTDGDGSGFLKDK